MGQCGSTDAVLCTIEAPRMWCATREHILESARTVSNEQHIVDDCHTLEERPTDVMLSQLLALSFRNSSTDTQCHNK